MIDAFGIMTRYKVNSHKSVDFLCKWQTDWKRNHEATLFTTASTGIKFCVVTVSEQWKFCAMG